VIDSGIDSTHGDLAANYAGGSNFVNRTASPEDDFGHGTHVAGTIAAVANGFGVVGVAPDARLYALEALDSTGSGSWGDIIAALQWAVDNGIQVTNNSYGSSRNPGSIVEAAFINAEVRQILSDTAEDLVSCWHRHGSAAHRDRHRRAGHPNRRSLSRGFRDESQGRGPAISGHLQRAGSAWHLGRQCGTAAGRRFLRGIRHSHECATVQHRVGGVHRHGSAAARRDGERGVDHLRHQRRTQP